MKCKSIFIQFVVAFTLTSVQASQCVEYLNSNLNSAITEGEVLASLRTEIAELVNSVVSRSQENEPARIWTSCNGSCVSLSSQLTEAIKEIIDPDYKVKFVFFMNSNKDLRFPWSRVHAFILVSGGPEPLIIDPTWKQFLLQPEKFSYMPDIFIGSAADLIKFFGNYREMIKPQANSDLIINIDQFVGGTWPLEDPNTGQYEILD